MSRCSFVCLVRIAETDPYRGVPAQQAEDRLLCLLREHRAKLAVPPIALASSSTAVLRVS